MTANVHRILVTIGALAAGAGGIMALPQWDILGIPETVGAIVTIIAALTIFVVNTIRANWADQ